MQVLIQGTNCRCKGETLRLTKPLATVAASTSLDVLLKFNRVHLLLLLLLLIIFSSLYKLQYV